jgi:hypothetical protein
MPSPKLLFSIGLFLMPIGCLVPNHYLPWPSFQEDAFVIGAFAVAATAALDVRRPSPWPAVAVLFAAVALVPLAQAAAGLVYFRGDAVVAFLYLALFALAIELGHTASDRYGPRRVLDPLLSGIVVAAIVSTAIALYQWLGLYGLGIFAADMPPGGRPFGNLAQPNLLATLAMVALVATHYLYQRKLLGGAGLVVASAVLCFGAVMTQSRVPWLQLTVYLGWLAASRHQAKLRVSGGVLAATAAGFAALALAWPSICDSLYLAPARALDQQTRAGPRWIHWQTLIDALERSPIFGYGWNQVSVAQAQTAADHPWSGEFIEHSHNILLDLLIWNGVPLGGVLIAAVLWWFVSRCRRVQEPVGRLLIGALLVVLIHALVEYPLEYAAFLLPVGLFMGVVESTTATKAPVAAQPLLQAALLVACFALAGWVAVEYLEVEGNSRTLRLEMAHIGTARIESEAPDVVLLTQQRELLRYARTEAKRDMTPDELDWMRKVSERFGYAPAVFRFALASGINGRPEAAQMALKRLCATQEIARCVEGREAWQSMAQGRFPELAAIQYPPIPLVTH